MVRQILMLQMLLAGSLISTMLQTQCVVPSIMRTYSTHSLWLDSRWYCFFLFSFATTDQRVYHFGKLLQWKKTSTKQKQKLGKAVIHVVSRRWKNCFLDYDAHAQKGSS